MKDISHVEDLVDEPVNGICYVMDYVEIHFDGSILRALSNPTVETPSSRHTFPEPGSRDALCELITAVVADVVVDEDRWIQLHFTGGQTFTIPLDDSHRRGPEAAHFVPWHGKSMDVF